MKLIHATLAVPAFLLIAGCGAQAPETASNSSAAAGREAIPEPGSAPLAPEVQGKNLADFSAPGGAAGTTEVTTASSAKLTQSKAIISRGQVSLESTDLDQARFELKKLLDRWGGTIANEESSADEEGRTDAQELELRVPSQHFGAAMDAISGLGTLVDRSRTSEDVTTQVIDINARVRSQKLSLARIQALLDRAESLNQVISIESQLSRRQAELESLEQQQKYLADQTAESTISVYLTLADDGTAQEDDEAGGFSAGLRDGWDAFRSTTTGVLQGLGALLPFGVVAAVIGVPAGLAWRRRRVLT